MDMGGDMPMNEPMPPMPQGDEVPPMDGMEPQPSEDEGETKDDLQTLAGKMSNIIQNGIGVDKDDVKAALNMVIAQAKKVLDGNDLKASANKLTNVDDVSDAKLEDGGQEEPMENQPQMESRKHLKKAVTEIFNGLTDGDGARKREDDKLTNDEIDPRNPWISNRK